MEEWKRILEATSYEVSNEGRVRNRNSGRVLKPVKNTTGVTQVSLREGNKSLTRSTNALRKRAFETE
jgi:hypothetical protein